MLLGCSVHVAKCVFVLPTAPEIGDCLGMSNADFVKEIEARNGNHWRKILTIMAKLTCGSADWREHKENNLFNNVCILFINDAELMQKLSLNDQVMTFFVGKQVRSVVPVPEHASAICTRRDAWATQNALWCPYLDYRQFPNALIDLIKSKMALSGV
ncbi:DUF6942 family protein [Marinomonas epiphytica]